MTDPVVVRAEAGAYRVHLRPGILADAGRVAGELLPGRRLALISDDTVAGLYSGRVMKALGAAELDATLYTFPAGEASKSRELWAALSDRMLDDGFGRDSAVVALGGGVTGDLAGFVASTYMRGVPVLQLPTSVVAMVDSAVGGKTGVDTPAGKNLVGAFHPPVAVLIDPEVVRTLEPARRSDGWVEAVKHGAIVDEEYLDSLEGDGPALVAGEVGATERAVRRSVEIKASVVTRDEREGGLRMILNFGHTLGHALEAASSYALGHGMAVAAGMVLEAELGESLGVTRAGTARRLAKALRAIDIAPEIPEGIEWPQVQRYLQRDKKARRGEARFVFLERVGMVSEVGGWSRPAPDDAVRRAFETTLLGD